MLSLSESNDTAQTLFSGRQAVYSSHGVLVMTRIDVVIQPY